MKKIFVFIVLGIFLLSTGFVVAQDEEYTDVPVVDGECPPDCYLNNVGTCTCPQDDFDEDMYEDNYEDDYNGELADPGITPDSAFYFLDDFFDRFGDKLENREEKIAEIKAMVEAGKYEAAKEALERYRDYVEDLEEEIEPEKLEKAKQSSEIIEETLKEIEEDIPEEYKEDFVDDVLEKEKNLLTAAEIAEKIQGLCVQLAELDPVQYSEVCNFEGQEAKWKKNMHKKLTKEQEQEAREFGQIMKQCFLTSGRECKCEDISFYDFSVACSKVAPLAAKCDAGSEDACRMMDDVDMPRLPDHLQDIFDDIEREFGEAKYEMHMPPECVEAGVTSPRECGKIMIKEHAPLECRQALLDSGCEEERECREICDKIMFEKHSPRECIDNGITDPSECARYMEKHGPEHFGPEMDCRGIQDPKARLECYDGFGKDMGEHYGVGDKYRETEGEITWQCKEHRIHWPPDCERFMNYELPRLQREAEEEYRQEWAEKDDWRIRERECIQSCGDKPWTMDNGVCKCGEHGQYYSPERGFYDESECKDGCSQECPGASRTDCVNERCVCFYDEGESTYSDSGEDYNNYDGPTDDQGCQCYNDCGEPTYWDYSCNCPLPPACNNEGDDYYADDYVPPEDGTPYTPDNEAIPGPADGGPSEPAPEPAPEPDPAPITGEVINNRFLNYWNR